MTRTCDYPLPSGDDCPNQAPHAIELKVGDIVYRVDVCDEHQGSLLDELREAYGFRPFAAWIDGRRRDAHISAKGKVFTTAEVRDWAIEQGLKKGSLHGRISNEHIEAYAAAH